MSTGRTTMVGLLLLTAANLFQVIGTYAAIQFGSESTVGRPPHRNVIEETLAAFPDMRVHNDPYDVQFGQGQWTVAMGRVSGTFTKPMQTPDGETIAPTGKRFETFFTTIAKWKNDQIVEEYVMLDPRDIMKQVVA